MPASTTTADRELLHRALALAERGRWTCAPNPMVGALVVRDGVIVGEGFHARAGEPHAEIHALQTAGQRAHGARLYVTLEPCSTHGRTPPCTDAICAAGIAHVTVGTLDPNPRHAGRGIALLRQAGIAVTVAHDEPCRTLNEKYNHFMTTGRPFVHAKWAMTLDGKIATRAGDARWISGEESRAHVHRLRSEYDAVLVGAGTVVRDDPALTVRLPGNWQQPVKVILDRRCRTPRDAMVLRDGAPLIVCTAGAPEEAVAALTAAGARVERLPAAEDGSVPLPALLTRLAALGLTSVLVEGGADVLGRFFDACLVNRVTVFVAPKIVGGAAALAAIGGVGWPTIAHAAVVARMATARLGDDTVISGVCVYPQ